MNYDDHYCRWSYEQLLLQQPHIEFRGLWRIGQRHFILCPEVDTAKTAEGENLLLWFNNACRVITAPVQLVAKCPPNAELVPERSAMDRAFLAGAPRNRRDILVDLGLALPLEFPPFVLDNPGTDVVMVTTHPLTPEQTEQAQSAYVSIGCYSHLQFQADSKRDLEKGEFRFMYGQGDIDLIPSRRLKGIYGRDLRFLVEEDEQFWTEKKKDVLTKFDIGATDLLPDEWSSTNRLGCFVDATVFRPENIRTYLTLYDTVHLALPLDDKFAANCDSLGVTPKELLELIELSRVKLLLPQSVDRYPLDWLNKVAEAAPQNLLFSRRLAAATIADARRRVPLLYAPLSPVERYTLLHAIATHAEALIGPARRENLIRFIAELGGAWSRAEWSVQARGAMGTSHLGIGCIAGAIYQEITGRDLRVELWSAAQKVEWAAVLGSHTFPSTSNNYDETNACDLVASIYTPSFSKQCMVAPSAELSAITDLLAIDNTASVVEFAKEFSSAHIRRLRDLVLRLTRENVDPDYLSDAIKSFNREVRHYEKRPDLVKTLNVIGILYGVFAAGSVDPSLQKFVMPAIFILNFVLNRIVDEIPRHSVVAGKAIDFLNSVLTGKACAGAVLVVRVRKDMARLKK